MTRRLPLGILTAGALLLAAAPASADAGTGCGSSPAGQPSTACESFDLGTLEAEVTQLAQQQNQAGQARVQSQISSNLETYTAAEQAAAAQYAAALAAGVSSIAAAAISQGPPGALMAHVPGGGPLSGVLAAERAAQRP